MAKKFQPDIWEKRFLQFWKQVKTSSLFAFLEKKFHKNHLTKISLDTLPLLVASVLVGLMAVAYERLFEIFESISLKIVDFSPYALFIVSPLCFLGSWLMVTRLAPTAGGSGIPQLMAAAELAETPKSKWVDKLLSLRIIVVKILSSLLMLTGGGAIGREGPTLQISGSVFQLIHRFASGISFNRVSQRVMIITGGASGLAAAFNTPLGGIVYVVEELTKTHIGKFRTAIFTAVIIAGMTAQQFLGSYLYLGFPKIATLPFNLIFWAILIPLFSGFLGSWFTRLVLALAELRKRFNSPVSKVVFVLSLGLLFAFLVYFTGHQSMGTGKPLINKILFTNPEALPWFTFPGRFFGSLISFGAGGAGGIFATSLSSGAAFGALVAKIADIPHQHENLLILLSMIGFLTGVTRSPFTSAILVLEMTDRHSAIFYFLMAGLLSNLSAGLVLRKSFYEIQKQKIILGFETGDHKKVNTKE